jgi:type VI secretion system Hcp family effector
MTHWSRWSSIAMCALVATIVALPTSADAWIAFAKVTTAAGVIDGDATDQGFEKQISVVGLGNSMDRPISSTGLAGALKMGPLQLVKRFDIATPKLLAAVAAATVLSKVEITIFKKTVTNTTAPAFKITLTNAQITQVDTSYDPGADPSAVEKLELVYQKFEWTDLISGVSRIIQ